MSGGNGGATGGSGNTTGCTRELLQTTLDAYFTALAAHDKSTLPLAASVKFTENGEAMELGSKGLWKTAGPVKYSQTALDTQKCMTASHAVVPDGNIGLGMSNNSTFLRSIREGTIHAVARRVHRGRTTWVWDVELTDDDGKLCAVSRVTIAVRPLRQ